MSVPVHFELEILCGTVVVPLCENQRGDDAFEADDDALMSDDESEVTCVDCLEALGFDVAPDSGNVRIAA